MPVEVLHDGPPNQLGGRDPSGTATLLSAQVAALVTDRYSTPRLSHSPKVPSEEIHSRRPLQDRPRATAPAVEGDENDDHDAIREILLPLVITQPFGDDVGLSDVAAGVADGRLVITKQQVGASALGLVPFDQLRQIRAAARLIRPIGTVSDPTMRAIEQSVALILGIDR